MTRILLADDHAIVRKGLKETLEDISSFKVRAEAGTGDEVLKRLREGKTDLVIMDISMPGRSGLEILAEIKCHWPRTAVLIYTMHPEVELAVRALKSGAAGYLTKETPLSELIEAVKKVADGGRYIAASIGAKFATQLADGSSSHHQRLSERELCVMKLIAEGKSLKQIAQQLSLNAKTISTYRARIFEKMDFRSNADLTRHVLKHSDMN